jgi:hypothetical protein
MDMSHPAFWVQSFLRSGAGGIYSDVIDSAMHGDRSKLDIAGEMGGPLPGFLSDVANVGVGPVRQMLDPSGRRAAAQPWSERGEDTLAKNALNMARRWTPQTWYTKTAVDRLLWDKLQMLSDPDYRRSFKRSEDFAKKQGSNFWFPPGSTTPARPPNMGSMIGR